MSMNGLRWWQVCGRVNGLRMLSALALRDARFDAPWYAFDKADRTAMAACAGMFVATGGEIDEQTIDNTIKAIGADVNRVKAVLAWAKPSDKQVIALRRYLLRTPWE